MIDMDKAILAAVKTGKVVFGANEAIRSAKTGKARLIVVASNSPHHLREDLECYGKMSQVPVVAYNGSSIDLGLACGKRFAIATLTIKEAGDSEILQLTEKPQAEQEVSQEEIEEA